MHDGSTVLLRKVGADYDAADRAAAFSYLSRHQAEGEVVTGLLFIDETKPDMHEVLALPAEPLSQIPYDKLNPGQKILNSIQDRFR
jgi:2-oxoglutarate ferredoxin oxidoreductase subunit beta